MKSTTRYTLIVLGIVVFLILAPLLILYVSGRTINLDGGDSKTTGILDAKTNPSDAKLQIDGNEHSSTPAIARFLKQGEYQFTLSKEGYYDWTKRLPIEAGKVTYAQEGVTEVQLLKKSEPKVLVPSGVSAFVLTDETLWFAQGTNLIKASLNDLAKQTVIPLEFAPTSLVLMRDKKLIQAQGTSSVIINTDNSKVYSSYGYADEAISVSDTQIISLYREQVRLINADSYESRLLRSNVGGFTMLGNTAYFIDYPSATRDKVTVNSALWNGTEFIDEQPLLVDVNIGKGRMIITDNKELFCLCYQRLFRIGQTLELVNNTVSSTYLDTKTNELSFVTYGNELYFYNFLRAKPQLLTRGGLSSDTAFLVRSSIGYGFVGTPNGLEAIEIDGRDKPNRYQLLSGKQVWQLAITDNQKTIIALQDGALVSVDIRN